MLNSVTDDEYQMIFHDSNFKGIESNIFRKNIKRNFSF